jgi:23S rRNA (uracil1939-C5)-methyltransferase
MNQIIEITLDAIAHGGEAIGRHEGKAIFVPYAIPGERVRVAIVEEKERWARGRLLEVLRASADRVTPPCPHFGPERCGGCQWQHIAYERQAELKGEIVADQLRRLGRLAAAPVADVVVLADDEGLLDLGYRNHVQFALASTGQPGFRRAASHEVIPIERCLLLSEPLDALHAALDIAWPELTGVTLRASERTGQSLVLLETRGTELPELELDLPAACAVLTPRGVEPLIGEPWIEEIVAGRRYRVSAESFFQVNTVGAEALVEIVRGYADVRPGDTVLDAYCGVGLFALALADAAAAVIGIESAPSACEDFAHNAAGLEHVELHEGAVDAVLPVLVEGGQRADIVVMDPPRSGAGEAVIRQIAALRPRGIVYVSCDPATLARDSVFLSAAGYALAEAQPVDLFPQTYHVETVALWRARP